MTSCVKCVPRSWCLARCLPGSARRAFRCPSVAASERRPIDLHLKGLEQLGATFDLDGGYIDGRVTGRLRGATIVFPFVSVGATEQLLMAASWREGQTVLANAARSAEITDLAECLDPYGCAHHRHRHSTSWSSRVRNG